MTRRIQKYADILARIFDAASMLDIKNDFLDGAREGVTDAADLIGDAIDRLREDKRWSDAVCENIGSAASLMHSSGSDSESVRSSSPGPYRSPTRSGSSCDSS